MPLTTRCAGGILHYQTKYGEDRYALVKGRYHQKWSFPKGHLQEEEDPFDCAMREIKEETGLEVLPAPTTSLQIGFGYYYIFEVDEEYPLVPKDTQEIINTKWMTIEEMRKMDINADVSQYVRMQME